MKDDSEAKAAARRLFDQMSKKVEPKPPSSIPSRFAALKQVEADGLIGSSVQLTNAPAMIAEQRRSQAIRRAHYRHALEKRQWEEDGACGFAFPSTLEELIAEELAKIPKDGL